MTKRRKRAKSAHSFAASSKPTRQREDKAGAVRVDAAGAYHCDTVLAVLAGRRALAPKDAELNEILRKAGERYAAHWTQGYRIGVAAQDMNRVRSDGSGGMLPMESAVGNAKQYQRASQCLGPYFSAVVDAIVLNEEPVESVGYRISGYSDRKQAIAVAMDRLREGLCRLAVLWDLLALDAVPTKSQSLRHESQARPDVDSSSRALRTHRPLAGM